MRDIKTFDNRLPEEEHQPRQNGRERVKTRESMLSLAVDAAALGVRTKPAKTIKKRPQDDAQTGQQAEEHPSGDTRDPAVIKSPENTPASSAQNGAVVANRAKQPEHRAAPGQVLPRTRRAILQVEATGTRQGAENARQSAADAGTGARSGGGSGARAGAGTCAGSGTGTGAGTGTGEKATSSSQRVSPRNAPRIKGGQKPRLMKRGVALAGRGVKYVVNKTTEQFSKDPSGSKRNPDGAVSDLAIRQSQALASKLAQLAARKAAQAAGRVAARLAAKVGQLLAQAIAKAMSALLAATGPVGVVIIVVLFAAILAAVLLSPMGIFAGGGGDGTPTISELAQSLTGELNAKISRIQQENTPYDELQVVYEGSEDNTFIDNWPDVLSVFAVKVNMDADNRQDVIVLDTDRQKILRNIFWDMNSVTYSIMDSKAASDSPTLPTASPLPSPTPTPSYRPIMLAAPIVQDDVPEPIITPAPTEVPTRKTLVINVNSRSYTEMEDEYQFTDEQRSMTEELMAPDMQSMFYNLIGQNPDTAMSPEQINEIRAKLPPDLEVSREKIALAAYSLVGKVEYFWGGKSYAVGWDDRWGTPKEVTSKGNPSTGTVRPFGLDCSGFVAWTFLNGGIPKKTIQEAFGTGSSVQWKNSVEITWDDILPGDLVFYNVPGTSKGNHVAVCVGFNDQGKPLIAESPRTGMRVKVSVASKSFKYVRRPIVLMN